MQAKFGAQLDFLVVEFTKLEVQLSQEVGLNAVSSPSSGGARWSRLFGWRSARLTAFHTESETT